MSSKIKNKLIKNVAQTKNIIKQDIDLLAAPSDAGGLPDFSNPINNFRYFFVLAAILFVVTFR